MAKDAQQNFPDDANMQMPLAVDGFRRHRAGALVRINLAPMMGRRDAVLDAASTLVHALKEDQLADNQTVYSYLNGLFTAADRSTFRISGMFNNADTVAREQRLAVHIGNLAKLAEALDEFSELKTRMHSAVAFYADDPASEFDSDYSDRINQRLSVIERNLLAQLYEYFDRVGARISRYRQYAVKNFSKDYLERYRKSYFSVMEKCDQAFEKFSVKNINPNPEGFFK